MLELELVDVDERLMFYHRRSLWEEYSESRIYEKDNGGLALQPYEGG